MMTLIGSTCLALLPLQEISALAQIAPKARTGVEWEKSLCDASIRLGRYWRERLDNQVRSLQQQLDTCPALSRLWLYLSPPRVTMDPSSGVALDALPVKLSSRWGARIRYTLDGTEVTGASALFEGSLTLRASGTLRARAFHGEGAQAKASSFEAQGEFQVLTMSDLQESRQFMMAPPPGLKVKVFGGNWRSLDKLEGQKPSAVKAATFFDESLMAAGQQGALEFSGYLSVPEDGLYTLALFSGSGSRLYVHNQLVVDHAGLDGAERVEGKAALKRGYHPIRVQCIHSSGARALEVRWTGPGIAGLDQVIPASVLSH